MDSVEVNRIAILGDGLTANAVRRYIQTGSEFEEVDIPDAELIVTSPGIPPREWPNVSVEIISDIEFAYRILKTKYTPFIIGITGTNGKTTVASGVAHALNTEAYGNIGVPLIELLQKNTLIPYIVLELSSYQLFSSSSLHCDMAIILNVEPDHLDWHGTLDHYTQAKLSIIKTTNQTLYIPKNMGADLVGHSEIRAIEELDSPSWPQFLGEHNRLNAAVIQDVAIKCGLSKATINTRMSTFLMPPFRCQTVLSRLGGGRIINDSKATNPSATLAAIKSISGDKAVILSGQPKCNFDDEWMVQIFYHCHTVYATGGLSQNKAVFPPKYWPKILFYSNLKDAVDDALKRITHGTILFSPSAASFDEFTNYMERGHAFNDYIQIAI